LNLFYGFFCKRGRKGNTIQKLYKPWF